MIGARCGGAWSLAWALLALASPATPATSRAQQPDSSAAKDSILENGVQAGESDADFRQRQRRNLINRKTWDWGFTTFSFGAGLLTDVVTYAQDETSKEQVSPEPKLSIRDARLLFGGKFRTKRPITWQTGFMYDGAKKEWFVRQTGLMIAVPELWGHLFVGRAKEGVSLNKVMVGYDGWTMERFTFSDVIPLLADGVKWLGYLPNRHLLWNVGWFTDYLSEGQSFSSYDNALTGRIMWVPMVSDSAGTLLHVGLNLRRGAANERKLQLRSRPESFTSPYYIDTGKFPAKGSSMVGLETYYRPGSWLFGSEYYFMFVDSPETHDPQFNGGDVSIAWLVTGETRSYNTVGGYFRSIAPTRTILQGGWGAWEPVLRLSYSDYDGGTIKGGKFWRLTPMFNWYLTDNARLEVAYGYGVLDRFEKKGVTQFFQSRLQLEF